MSRVVSCFLCFLAVQRPSHPSGRQLTLLLYWDWYICPVTWWDLKLCTLTWWGKFCTRNPNFVFKQPLKRGKTTTKGAKANIQRHMCLTQIGIMNVMNKSFLIGPTIWCIWQDVSLNSKIFQGSLNVSEYSNSNSNTSPPYNSKFICLTKWKSWKETVVPCVSTHTQQGRMDFNSTLERVSQTCYWQTVCYYV